MDPHYIRSANTSRVVPRGNAGLENPGPVIVDRPISSLLLYPLVMVLKEVPASPPLSPSFSLPEAAAPAIPVVVPVCCCSGMLNYALQQPRVGALGPPGVPRRRRSVAACVRPAGSDSGPGARLFRFCSDSCSSNARILVALFALRSDL